MSARAARLIARVVDERRRRSFTPRRGRPTYYPAPDTAGASDDFAEGSGGEIMQNFLSPSAFRNIGGSPVTGISQPDLIRDWPAEEDVYATHIGRQRTIEFLTVPPAQLYED